MTAGQRQLAAVVLIAAGLALLAIGAGILVLGFLGGLLDATVAWGWGVAQAAIP